MDTSSQNRSSIRLMSLRLVCMHSARVHINLTTCINDRSNKRLRVGNLSLPVGVLLYNAKVLFRVVKICKLIPCEAETFLFLLKVISFSFLNRIVACMLSMAKGIKVGSGVRVLRGKFSTQKGVVQASEGVGRV